MLVVIFCNSHILSRIISISLLPTRILHICIYELNTHTFFCLISSIGVYVRGRKRLKFNRSRIQLYLRRMVALFGRYPANHFLRIFAPIVRRAQSECVGVGCPKQATSFTLASHIVCIRREYCFPGWTLPSNGFPEEHCPVQHLLSLSFQTAFVLVPQDNPVY